MALEVQIGIIGKVALAILLGGVIGIEREIARKPAGVRTNMLVSGGAALLISLGGILVSQFENANVQDIIRTDPIRIIEAIVVGVSFIGAGTIIQRPKEEAVDNLTTAASFLFTAGIGMATAMGQFYIAVGLTILVLIINFLLARLVKMIKNRAKSRRQY